MTSIVPAPENHNNPSHRPSLIPVSPPQRGGRVTFFGPLGQHSAGLVGYLEKAVPGEGGRAAGREGGLWWRGQTCGSHASRNGRW